MTVRLSRLCVPPPPGRVGGTSFFCSLLLVCLWLPAAALAGAACDLSADGALSDADYRWIADGIFQNETGGEERYLTYWGAGEDFPSFGIGHFIWFPAGVDAPFDESFPPMFEFVRRHASTPPPEWLTKLAPFDAPWPGKAEFDQQLTGRQLHDLRDWLRATASTQARYIVCSFARRWAVLDLPDDRKQDLQPVLDALMQSAAGRFALVDYYNFKGLGTNPRERYGGRGWGLVQVLGDVADAAPACAAEDAACWLRHFSHAAAARLGQRVERSPPERNEGRWLPGWESRVAAYSNSRPAVAIDPPATGFWVTPYLQSPTPDAISVRWFSHGDNPGRVEWWPAKAGDAASGDGSINRVSSAPRLAGELAYADAEPGERHSDTLPYRHDVRLTGLEPGTRYHYRVYQDRAKAGASFATPDASADRLRLIVYADSETEPESHGKPTAWPGSDDKERVYLVDQSVGYTANLDVIVRRAPAFVAIAGDLVQSGGEQRDWDEFWKHNARLAAHIPIVPAPGNHEYFGGPGSLGAYAEAARAIAKYDAYFAGPSAFPDSRSSDATPARYYTMEYGPVSLIVIDSNDGLPQQSASDTNWRLDGVAPPWNPGSAAYRWLEAALATAQQRSPFTFVMFHQAPYASGVHNQPPGLGPGKDYLSGIPLRVLTPLFLRYGVDAVFNGHDEVYEHSIVSGKEQLADGRSKRRQLHFFVVGIGGDGLRESFPGVRNPQQVFSADKDAPERWVDGVLEEGGRHYGHLEVNLSRDQGRCWTAVFDPVYVFPVFETPDRLEGFERRVYDDQTKLQRCAPTVAERAGADSR